VRNTIKSRADFDLLFKRGKTISTPYIIARFSRIPEQRDQSGRVAYVAGKKTGNAVMRNRCKRVMREAARRSGAPWRGYDVILIARDDRISHAPYDDVLLTMDRISRRLNDKVRRYIR
jgi:ribonuclease P protein component